MIRVHVSTQKLEWIEQGQVVWSAPVSTATLGLGEKSGSYKTPRGLHIVVKKIGDSEPLGTIFKGRQKTGRIWSSQDISVDEDLILTRILWLGGQESHNQNTFDRYIYIHGTNHEEKIGKPVSHGCIRMKNEDVVHLYELASVGTKVEILE